MKLMSKLTMLIYNEGNFQAKNSMNHHIIASCITKKEFFFFINKIKMNFIIFISPTKKNVYFNSTVYGGVTAQ